MASLKGNTLILFETKSGSTQNKPIEEFINRKVSIECKK